MTAKRPHPVDVHVGSRVKMRRMLLGMSQEKLGEQLSLTFQQVQKYEKGSNRIGSSRLWQLSQILDVPVRYFFEGLQETAGAPGFAEAPQQDFVMDFVKSSEGLNLIKPFTRIEDPQVRRAVVNLVRALAGRD